MAKKPVRKQTALVAARAAKPTAPRQLLGELRQLIDDARTQVAQVVNSGLSLLYWRIGERIRREILQSKRAEYGEKIVSSLAQQLTVQYGAGFSRQNLFRMIRFAEVFPDQEIVSSLVRQLSWTHLIYIIPIEDDLKREFYAEMCRVERWSTRTLRHQIDHLLFERTAVSRKPVEQIAEDLADLREADRLTPDLVFRDPYVLDFLGLPQQYDERDLEHAILRELEAFILELGGDFAFVARQKRITVDGEDYYLDLLFYHRRLHRLVAIDLKLGKFRAADKGQMELYLRWLEKHDIRPGENPPLGLILCADKSAEHVELLQLAKSGIRVAEYLTELPDRQLLQRKLHQSMILARKQLQRREIRE